jgi:16S rRNA processing protein RimM
MEAPGRLLAGEVGKPHGIAGEVHVMPISDDPRRFEAGSTLLHADGRRLTVESARSHRNRLLVKFAGVDDRDQAGRLRGALYVSAAEARELPPGEYWPHELIGCRVVRVGGDDVGEVSDVIPGAAHDLLVVRTDRGDRLVPLVKEIVIEVDTDKGTVTLDPPAGLLEP